MGPYCLRFAHVDKLIRQKDWSKSSKNNLFFQLHYNFCLSSSDDFGGRIEAKEIQENYTMKKKTQKHMK